MFYLTSVIMILSVDKLIHYFTKKGDFKMTMYYYTATYYVNDKYVGPFTWTYISGFYKDYEIILMLMNYVNKHDKGLVKLVGRAITADEYFKAVLA